MGSFDLCFNFGVVDVCCLLLLYRYVMGHISVLKTCAIYLGSDMESEILM